VGHFPGVSAADLLSEGDCTLAGTSHLARKVTDINASQPTLHTAIVLQGGGALGAYEYGVLKALYEQRPNFQPIAVTGVSIGALTATVLGGAKGDPIDALEDLWHDRLVVPRGPGSGILPSGLEQYWSYWGNPGMFAVRRDLWQGPLGVDSYYDTAPLRRTLTDLVDPAKLASDPPRVIVGATELSSGEMEYFDSFSPRGLTFDHVVASCSLPPAFPATKVDGKYYWDGGLFSNLPLEPAINALEDAADGDRSAVRELIVVELFPMDAAIPRTMPEVNQRMKQLQYTSRLRLDRRFFGEINRLVDLAEDLEQVLPPDSPIRTNPAFEELRSHRKVNRFSVVTTSLPPELSHASDFTRASIEARIEAGYCDAQAQGVCHPADRTVA
jgi:NTE family protein